MNTKNLKAYAPKARTQFIEAVKKRAAHFGIYEDRIEEVRIEGGAAIIEGRAFTRKEGEQRKRLESKVTERGYDMFIREMAYTWFNRLAALRYMEIHDYFDYGFRVLSHPTNPESLPEILSHASDVADSLDLDKSQIVELQLAGDKEEELYRELLLGQCHHLYKTMPFMFEAIDDATELLLPNNLTKTDSILKGFINDIPEEDWQEIEVIGWLYQFYISEHKDAVIGKVVKSEDIPAATQLFTPNWIVKYLVQNSVGRQWLATYPDSELKGKMDYYIEPAEQSEEIIEQLKAITPTSIDPEEIKVLDPACGSGHILVEVYEVLREIYLERGYRLREIPELILNKNIYGLDIDDRAAQLAGFALMMKAREDDRRIFQRVEDGEVSLNVFSLQSTEHLDIPKLWRALDLEGNQQVGATGGLFDTSEEFVQPTGIYKEYFDLLQTLKSAFLQAKTLGSLIQIEDRQLNNLLNLQEELGNKAQGSDPASKLVALEILPIVNQAIVLAQRYDSVIANPPYMGFRYLNNALKDYLLEYYSEYTKDLYAACIIANLRLTKPEGFSGYMTPMVWMFIDSFYDLRCELIDNNKISSLIQLEYNASGSVRVPLCTFVIQNTSKISSIKSQFIRLTDFAGDSNQGPKTLEAINNKSCGWYYETDQKLFKNIDGCPISYWLSIEDLEVIAKLPLMSSKADAKQGLSTGNTEQFLRYWYEVDFSNIGFDCSSEEEFFQTGKKWCPYNKGGSFRKWYGNQDYVVNWLNRGQDIESIKPKSVVRNKQFYFKECLSWSDVTSAINSFRYYPRGFIFDTVGHSAFFQESENIFCSLASLNSTYIQNIIPAINPTLHFSGGYFLKLPLLSSSESSVIEATKELISISKSDWNESECSFGFVKHPLISSLGILSNLFNSYVIECEKVIKRAKNLEDGIQKLFSEEFGVNAYETPISQISLNKNIHYRYDRKLDAEVKIARFQSETLSGLLSYYIGIAMGRFSLNEEGVVYAKTGGAEFTISDSESRPFTFVADEDGIIPLASEEWLFDDDATTRFKEFVKTVWGDEHLSENLEFVAESLCLHSLKPKKGESAMDTIRRYFSMQFFKDHCKTYKKRPIYWLFSSGKEKAFECLVYLHRYNEGTLSRMRTEYVTPLMGKYDAQHTLLSEQQLQATGTEARRIEKELKSLEKKQAELRTFDEQLKHYAEMRITLDLDDGVKANYGKFGNLLADVKAIHGNAVK